MKKLPRVRVNKAPSWQRKRLAHWLADWAVHKRLPGGNPPKASGGRAGAFGDRLRAPATLPARAKPAGESREVRAGQIRLLYPSTPGTRDRLLHVAVLEEEAPTLFAVAPFGRFAEPGLPGEWLTGRPEPSLRVLCLWNGRILPGSIIRDGWVVDQLSDLELADARAVWDSQHGRSPLPARLEKQVGPPLVHPLDLRRDYQEEEKAFMDAVQSFAQSASTPAATASSYERPEDAAELALAAESRGTYGAVSRFRLEGSPLALQITSGPELTQRAVLVVDENGQPSRLLDGSVLQEPDGTKSRPISNARVVVPKQLLTAGAVVAMPTGVRLSLRVET